MNELMHISTSIFTIMIQIQLKFRVQNSAWFPIFYLVHHHQNSDELKSEF